MDFDLLLHLFSVIDWWPTPTSVEEVLPAPNMELLLLRAFDLDHHGSGKALISLEDRVVTLKDLEGHEVMLHLLLRGFAQVRYAGNSQFKPPSTAAMLSFNGNLVAVIPIGPRTRAGKSTRSGDIV